MFKDDDSIEVATEKAQELLKKMAIKHGHVETGIPGVRQMMVLEVQGGEMDNFVWEIGNASQEIVWIYNAQTRMKKKQLTK